MLDLSSGALGRTAHQPDAVAPPARSATAELVGKVLGETDEEMTTFIDGAGGTDAVVGPLLEALGSGVEHSTVGDLRLGFEISSADGTVHRWVLEVADTGTQLHVGQDPADLTLRTSAVDLLRMGLGSLDPVAAIMDGRLSLEGDLELLSRISSLFSDSPGGAMGGSLLPAI
jgi:hypothetical protein